MRSKYLALLLVPFSSLLLAGTPISELSSTPVQTTITRLILRDRTITISQDIGGVTRYDVHTNSGQPLDLALDLTQLQAKYPKLYDSLQPAVADGEAESIMMLNLDSLEL